MAELSFDDLLASSEDRFQKESIESSRVERRQRSIDAGLSFDDLIKKKQQADTADLGPLERVQKRFLQTDVPPGRNKLVEGARTSATVAGTTAGAIVGARTPILPGPLGVLVNPLTGTLVGGGLGATAGTFFPETTMDLLESLGMLPEGTRETEGRPQSELKTIAAGEVATELLVGSLGQFPRVAAGSATRKLTRSTSASREIADFGSVRLGVELLPFQMSGENNLGRGIINVLGRLPLVGASARDKIFLHFFRHTQGQKQTGEQAQRAIENIATKMGDISTFPDLSHAILGEAKALLVATNKRFRPAYEEVFRLATKNGVRITPRRTYKAAKDLLTAISERSPTSKGKKVLSVSDAKLSKFLNSKKVLGLDKLQRLKEFDGAITGLDQFIKKQKGKNAPRQLIDDLNTLRNGMLEDVTKSIFGGRNPKEIGSMLRNIDRAYSDFLGGIFETSTALKFGRVVKGGLRGGKFIQETTSNISGIAKSVLDLNDIKAIDDLMSLMTLKTGRKLTATVVEEGFNSSMRGLPVAGGFAFDGNTARVYFGLTSKTSGRKEAMERMLRRTGSPLTLDDIERTIQVFEKVKHFQVADASTLIQRKLVFSMGMGGGAVVGGFLGGGLIAAGSGGLAAAAAMFLGSRAMVRALSNPAGAKSWRLAISSDAKLGAKRAAALRFLRIGMQPSQDEISAAGLTGDELAVEENNVNELFQAAKSAIDDLFEQIKSNQ